VRLLHWSRSHQARQGCMLKLALEEEERFGGLLLECGTGTAPRGCMPARGACCWSVPESKALALRTPAPDATRRAGSFYAVAERQHVPRPTPPPGPRLPGALAPGTGAGRGGPRRHPEPVRRHRASLAGLTTGGRRPAWRPAPRQRARLRRVAGLRSTPKNLLGKRGFGFPTSSRTPT